MGIQYQDVCFLVEARCSGVRFGRVLTLGRQTLMAHPDQIRGLFTRAGLDGASPALDGLRQGEAADALFLALGAESVAALDADGYEGASVVHDLNDPVPDGLRRHFDMVYDGGSLEHVFNVPVALASVMDLVVPGGRLFFSTPANQFCGHGFYQFSPELYHRVLTEENGYALELMLAVQEMDDRGRPYRVTDPLRLGRRVTLESGRPVTLLVQALRTGAGPVLSVAPQQSDYVTLWEGGHQSALPAPARHGPLGRALRALLDTIQRRRPALAEVRRALPDVLLPPGRRPPHPFRDTAAFTPFTWRAERRTR